MLCGRAIRHHRFCFHLCTMRKRSALRAVGHILTGSEIDRVHEMRSTDQTDLRKLGALIGYTSGS